ncbi:MAG: polymer-forming cytoskeletal protein [Chloroflexi bacterium]|nr:polymer-forming cytoskeletal protein [Chloroflexota bacterium]
MFGREKTEASVTAPSTAPVSKIETVLGPNARFQGEIQSDGGVRIDGVFEGVIDITGNLVIAESAKVMATIKANNISISGAIKGDISANRVEILETGRVWGDLAVNSLLLNEGAYLRGQTIMHGDIEFPMLEAPKTKPAPKPAAPEIVDVEPKTQ